MGDRVQDWEVLTLATRVTPARKDAAPRPAPQLSQEAARARRAEQETESFRVHTVDRKVAAEIRDGRRRKQWTQKQLAQAINERVDVVQAWEDGKAQPNGQLLVKIRRALK